MPRAHFQLPPFEKIYSPGFFLLSKYIKRRGIFHLFFRVSPAPPPAFSLFPTNLSKKKSKKWKMDVYNYSRGNKFPLFFPQEKYKRLFPGMVELIKMNYTTERQMPGAYSTVSLYRGGPFQSSLQLSCYLVRGKRNPRCMCQDKNELAPNRGGSVDTN